MPKGNPTSEEYREQGCKCADIYYAGIMGMSKKEVKGAYVCSNSSSLKTSAECPFPGECLKEMKIPKQRKLGYVEGILAAKVVGAKLIAVNVMGKNQYECSHCGATRPYDIMPTYCMHCGVKVK